MGATGTPEGSEDNNNAETFTQEQVDAIVKDRLSREREKYKDYADLKNKAAEYDKQQEANKSELQKALDKSAALEKELSGMKEQEKIRSIRAKVSSDTGVPSELLTGSTEDDCKAQAEAILKFAKGGKYPGVKGTGNNNSNSNESDSTATREYRELAHQIFGKKGD